MQPFGEVLTEFVHVQPSDWPRGALPVLLLDLAYFVPQGFGMGCRRFPPLE